MLIVLLGGEGLMNNWQTAGVKNWNFLQRLTSLLLSSGHIEFLQPVSQSCILLVYYFQIRSQTLNCELCNKHCVCLIKYFMKHLEKQESRLLLSSTSKSPSLCGRTAVAPGRYIFRVRLWITRQSDIYILPILFCLIQKLNAA